jgi:dynein heavy chain
MRSLKAILTAAGELKRNLQESEDTLALKVLIDVNLPKFTLEDIDLYLSIVSDLFPGSKRPERGNEDLAKAMM